MLIRSDSPFDMANLESYEDGEALEIHFCVEKGKGPETKRHAASGRKRLTSGSLLDGEERPCSLHYVVG
jgi:hypothetical protein